VPAATTALRIPMNICFFISPPDVVSLAEDADYQSSYDVPSNAFPSLFE